MHSLWTRKVGQYITFFFSLLQYHALEKFEGISSETMLLLWSMKERHNGDSQFKIYFDTLPEEFHTGTCFAYEISILILCNCEVHFMWNYIWILVFFFRI